MKIQFTQSIEIKPTIVGHSAGAVEVSGILENPERVFCNIWEDVGDEELKRWLYADGFHMVKRDSENVEKVNAKFTKGQWKHHGVHVVSEGNVVCDTFPIPIEGAIASAEERQANAKLIAAAPDMLEALKEAEAALTHEYWMTGEAAAVVRAAIDKSPHIIKIRAAIKKATE